MPKISTMSSVLSGLVSWLIHCVLSIFRQVVRYWTEDRYLKRFFGFGSEFAFYRERQDVAVVVARVKIDPEGRPMGDQHPGTTGYGELKLATRLLPVLWTLYSHHRDRLDFYLSGSVKNLDGKHLVLLGGPFYNSEAKAVLSRDDVAKLLPITSGVGEESKHEGTVIFERTSQGQTIKRQATLDDAGRVIEDYCLIIKMPNPFDRDKIAILVIGARTHGVEYAAQFLKDRNLLRELLSHPNVGRGHFCTLIPLCVHWEVGDLEPRVEPKGSRIGVPFRLAVS